MSPTYIQDLVKEKVSLNDFRNKKQVEIPQVSSKRYGMKSLPFEEAHVWNSVPNKVRLAENYKRFRILLQTLDGVNFIFVFPFPGLIPVVGLMEFLYFAFQQGPDLGSPVVFCLSHIRFPAPTTLRKCTVY